MSWLLSEARHVRFDDPAEEARFVRQIWWEHESFFEEMCFLLQLQKQDPRQTILLGYFGIRFILFPAWSRFGWWRLEISTQLLGGC